MLWGWKGMELFQDRLHGWNLLMIIRSFEFCCLRFGNVVHNLILFAWATKGKALFTSQIPSLPLEKVYYVIGYKTSGSFYRFCFYSSRIRHLNSLLLLLLPLALQPTVGFGMSEKCSSIFSYLPPTLSIFSLPALEDLFLLPLSIFSWVFFFWKSFIT